MQLIDECFIFVAGSTSQSMQSDSTSATPSDDTRIRLTDLQSFLSGVTSHSLEQTDQVNRLNNFFKY